MKGWARWVGLALLTTVALAGCGSNNSTTAVTLSVSPGSATVLLNTSVQFIPTAAGSTNAVDWSVNGVLGGNATVGTIDVSGLYTAPSTLPSTGSGVVAQVISAVDNSAIPGSGATGAVIQLRPGSDFSQFVAGNQITVAGSSVAGWNSTFPISFAATLSNGNYAVQIPFQGGSVASGTGGTATIAVGITITAQIENTSAVANARITLDSGIRVSISPSGFTIGTNETFNFFPTYAVSGTANQAVTWSLTGVGSIDPGSGLYTAPGATGTATVTATSAADTAQFANATVTIVAAVDPTITSITPPAGALGATSQQVYLSGSNFISTTSVLVNHNPIQKGIVSLSSSTLLVVVPDSILSTLPTAPATTVPLTFTVERQGGGEQGCSTPCQLTLSAVRPAVVGVTPDSIQTTGGKAVTLDGGYFGTSNSTPGFPGSAVVSVLFNGQPVPSPSFLSDRQLSFTLAAPALSGGPGLYPISVTNKVAGSANGSMAVVNLAVQPSPSSPVATSFSPVGTTPSSIAIDTAAGVAVVANKGSNDITVVGLGTLASPALGAQKLSLCTGSIGTLAGTSSIPCPVASGPVSVAVDNLRHLALVANSGSANLAVVNISNPAAPAVTTLVSFPSASTTGTAFFLAPQAVGINSVSGTALIAFTSTINGSKGSNVGAILDMNQLATPQGTVTLPAAVINVVNINNGPNPHIAVSSRLNWALSTPGGAGSLSIVDLGRQTKNSISGISCSSGTVTVTTTSTVSLRAGQPVLITGASPAGFNGIFSGVSPSGATFAYFLASCPAATGGGGAASYSLPVATVATNSNVSGVAINDESQKALLVDPSVPPSVPVFVFNILDQSSTLVAGATFGNVAAAMNPLTNIGVVVNQTNSNVSEIDPTTPTQLSSFSTGTSPADIAIDPATDTALVVTPGPPAIISMFPLGALRSVTQTAPQIAQSSVTPAGGGTQSSSQVILNSSLGSAAVPQNQTLTLIGNFPGGSVPRLDGDPAPFSGVSISNGGRMLTATLSGATLAGNGPRQYAIDVLASGLVSNAARLQVIQAVSLITSDCAAPAPQGVAINSVLNVAIVTEPGCNDVSMVSLSTSTGFPIGTGFSASPELAVGTTPTGVAVSAVANLAVVANSGSNSVSVVDMVNDGVPTTFTTDPIPAGVAINPGTGQAVVASNGASVVDTFPVATTAQTPSRITVQQGPIGVAIDSVNNLAVVANSTANDASLVNLGASVTTHSTNPGSIPFPQGVAFDPITDTFMITASANNQVVLLNPNTGQTAGIHVGIGPSSIAYNFASGALVTANNLSGTMTVVDFLDQTVRGVFSLPSSTQFAVDIHPLTNLAVVADPVHHQVLLVPLPH